MEIDFGLFAIRTLGSAVKDKVVEYLQEHLPALLDPQGKLAVNGAYAVLANTKAVTYKRADC